jgi:hypothetical protein
VGDINLSGASGDIVATNGKKYKPIMQNIAEFSAKLGEAIGTTPAAIKAITVFGEDVYFASGSFVYRVNKFNMADELFEHNSFTSLTELTGSM